MDNVWLILAMAIVTFIPRYLPFALAARLKLPPVVEQALTYVPIAVLSVIIVQTTLYRQGSLSFSTDNPYLPAAVFACILARLQPRLLVTVVGGLLCFYTYKGLYLAVGLVLD